MRLVRVPRRGPIVCAEPPTNMDTMDRQDVHTEKKLSGFIALREGFLLVVPAAWLLAGAVGSAGIWGRYPGR